MDNKFFEVYMSSINDIVLNDIDVLEYKEPNDANEGYIFYTKDDSVEPTVIAVKDLVNGMWSVTLRDLFGNEVDTIIFERDTFYNNYFEQLSIRVREWVAVDDDDLSEEEIDEICSECDDED